MCCPSYIVTTHRVTPERPSRTLSQELYPLDRCPHRKVIRIQIFSIHSVTVSLAGTALYPSLAPPIHVVSPYSPAPGNPWDKVFEVLLEWSALHKADFCGPQQETPAVVHATASSAPWKDSSLMPQGLTALTREMEHKLLRAVVGDGTGSLFPEMLRARGSLFIQLCVKHWK